MVPKHGRHDLPWRQIYENPSKKDSIKSGLLRMLQQTQVDRVIGYYTRFSWEISNDWIACQDDLWRTLPLLSGSRILWTSTANDELAHVVVEKYNGIFPDDFEKLRKLPGIGQYTAQALLAFGYDTPVLAMDANLMKIFARYYFGSRHMSIKSDMIEDLERQLSDQKSLGGSSITHWWTLVLSCRQPSTK